MKIFGHVDSPNCPGAGWYGCHNVRACKEPAAWMLYGKYHGWRDGSMWTVCEKHHIELNEKNERSFPYPHAYAQRLLQPKLATDEELICVEILCHAIAGLSVLFG